MKFITRYYLCFWIQEPALLISPGRRHKMEVFASSVLSDTCRVYNIIVIDFVKPIRARFSTSCSKTTKSSFTVFKNILVLFQVLEIDNFLNLSTVKISNKKWEMDS